MGYGYFKTASKKTKVFISFDFDYDEDLKNLLVGQAKNDGSPFEIIDMSVKEELSGDWKEKVKKRIIRVDQVIVICGKHTDMASGVIAEVEIAQEVEKPYFLIWGRSDETCKKPRTAKDEDKIYSWTWDNLKKLLDGER